MKYIVALVLAVFFSTGCDIHTNMIIHDEDKAIESANLFFKAVTREDSVAAYAQISDLEKQKTSFGEFDSFLKANRERQGAFTRIAFDSYQPVPGQRAIQLYYNISHQRAGNVLYHLVLRGDGGIGYEILIVDVGNYIPYPSNMKYFGGIPRIKKNKIIEVPVE